MTDYKNRILIILIMYYLKESFSILLPNFCFIAEKQILQKPLNSSISQLSKILFRNSTALQMCFGHILMFQKQYAIQQQSVLSPHSPNQ